MSGNFPENSGTPRMERRRSAQTRAVAFDLGKLGMAAVRCSRVSGKRSTAFFDYANSSVEENRVWTELPRWKPDNSQSPKRPKSAVRSGDVYGRAQASAEQRVFFPSELVSSEE